MARKTPAEFELEISQLVFGGEGMGHFDGRPVFVYGVLPGETVLVRPLKVNSRYVRAVLIKVIKSATNRIEPKSDHYLTCSPWQIIDYTKQLEYKKNITISMWRKLAHVLPTEDVEIIASPNQWHYRNKLEFSVTADNNNQPCLAFHQRFRHSQFYPLESCYLGSETMNKIANLILEQAIIHDYNLENIKNILVRYSDSEQKVIGVLYTTNREGKIFLITHPDLNGFCIIYSDPRSPAAVNTEVLSMQGKLELTENIAGINLSYGVNSFFQVNAPAFTLLMNDIKKYLPKEKNNLLDLYAGVGTIGLALAADFHKVISIEINKEASKFAIINTKNNKLNNVKIIQGSSEKQPLEDLFAQVDTVVVDPPRAGLHASVSEVLATTGPQNLIYISCNPSTQARDWSILNQAYNTVYWGLYDLYPQTPHVESVLVLSRKNKL